MLKNKSVPVSRETNSTRDLVTHAIVRGISRQNSQLPQPVFIRPGHLNTHPLCWTSLTPNYKRNVINNSLDMIVTKTEGFVMTSKEKFTKPRCKHCRLDGYSSWFGKTVGAYTEISFKVPALFPKEGVNNRSVVIAIRSCWVCGTANIWLDNKFDEKRRINLRDQLARALVKIIAFRVKPGEHTLNIKIVKTGPVSLVGLMLGPPDGP
jgi:hypothetical protein